MAVPMLYVFPEPVCLGINFSMHVFIENKVKNFLFTRRLVW